MTVISRYLVERGPDQFAIAMREITTLSKERGIGSIMLAVPKKQGWGNSMPAQVLGEAVTKTLLKGTGARLGADGPQLSLESVNTFRSMANMGVVVGVHIAVADMAKIDDTFDAKAIVYLPWAPNEGEEWLKTWLPTTWGSSTATPVQNGLPQAVEDALERLTRNINLGSGLGHPSDKEMAVRLITKLRAEGHVLDPADIRRWALRHSWSSSAASDLEKIVQKANRY